MYEQLNRADLDMMFKGSIVVYNKTPVLITGVDEDNNLNLSRLTSINKKVKSANPDDPKFDFTPVKLGMCNVGNSTVFVERMPMRAYKIGVCKETLKVHDFKSSRMEDLDKIMSFRDLTSLKETILDEYPSLEWSLANVGKEGRIASAFTRWFAIDKAHRLYHKNKEVGMINADNAKPVFFPHKSYLKEVFNNA